MHVNNLRNSFLILTGGGDGGSKKVCLKEFRRILQGIIALRDRNVARILQGIIAERDRNVAKILQRIIA